VDIVLVGRRELAQTRPVNIHLEDLPIVVAAGHGKQQALAVPVQIEIHQQSQSVGLIEPLDGPVRCCGRENADVVLPVEGLFDARIALGALTRIARNLALHSNVSFPFPSMARGAIPSPAPYSTSGAPVT
jgi:hypothetical protein